MSSQSSINIHPTNTLNPGDHHHNHHQQQDSGSGIIQTGNGGIIPSQIGLPIGQNSIIVDGNDGSGCSNMQQHQRQNIMIERIQNHHHTNAMNGQISPSSSSGSTHLIYNGPTIMHTNTNPVG